MNKSSFIILLCIGFSLFISCENRDTSPAVKPELVISYFGDERIFFQDYWGMEATYLVFLPMLRVVPDGSGNVEGVLARDWKHSDDYRTWTYYLREDIEWHDGHPFSAHDIEFTLDLRNHDRKEQGLPVDFDVTVIDSFTVSFRSENPTDGTGVNGLGKRMIYEVYYPRHLLEDKDPAVFFSWDFWKQPVGNGPYKYVRHEDRTMTELHSNEQFFQGKPAIDKVTLKYSSTSALQELLGGQVDVLTYVSPDILFKMQEQQGYKAYHWWGDVFSSIYWNHTKPLFSDPEIRRALTMCINREMLRDILFYPEEVLPSDGLMTDAQMYRNYTAPALPYDPEQCRQILTNAAWRMRDGLLYKDDKPFSFTLITTPRLEKTAVFVQDQLRKSGIEVRLSVTEYNLMKQSLENGEYEAILNTTYHSLTTPSFGERDLFGENSLLGYENKEIVNLMNQASQTVNAEALDSIYTKMSAIIMEEMPVTQLLPQTNTFIVPDYVRGLQNKVKANPVRYMTDLTIED